MAWIVYTVGCFLIMLIGFDWKVSIPVAIIVGFVCGLFNEIIQVLLKLLEKFGDEESKEADNEKKN